MKLIQPPEGLEAFRQEWTGERTLDLLRKHEGRLLVNWEVGVGKSYNLDSTIEAAAHSGLYDLVVALLPTRQVIDERRWIQNPPRDLRVENLKARPKGRCGELDPAWSQLEQRDLGALGRIELCGSCPHRSGCYWPGQYGKRLRGAQVIFATHAQIQRSPTFLAQLKQWTQSERVLVLFDEVNFIMSSLKRSVCREDLERFTSTLAEMNGSRDARWFDRCKLLLVAPTEDLRSPDWLMPWIDTQWARAVQRRGVELHGDRFRFIGYDLQQFGISPLESREKSRGGDLHYVALPRVKHDFIIYSGTAQPELLQYRLGRDFAAPFADHHFSHPETVWYNLASRLGMRSHFLSNAPQILDFFAQLTARRLQEGRKVLLVAKKCFLASCAREMQARLRELGIRDARVIHSHWSEEDLQAPHTIPLINYGTIGTNLFEAFDCAYCLTGYYVNERVVNSVLQDLPASDLQIPIRISTEGIPRRRQAKAVRVQDRYYEVSRLAQQALDQQEMDEVLQAVGRVRPYTQPREVITFQCDEHPRLTYTKEFNSLGEARLYFTIQTRQALQRNHNAERVRQARKSGLNQKEAVEQTGLGLRTIQRYWNKDRPAKNPLYIHKKV